MNRPPKVFRGHDAILLQVRIKGNETRFRRLSAPTDRRASFLENSKDKPRDLFVAAYLRGSGQGRGLFPGSPRLNISRKQDSDTRQRALFLETLESISAKRAFARFSSPRPPECFLHSAWIDCCVLPDTSTVSHLFGRLCSLPPHGPPPHFHGERLTSKPSLVSRKQINPRPFVDASFT